MGYPPRKLTHGLHLLRLAELIFEEFQLGDIGYQSIVGYQASLAVITRDRRVPDPADGAVLVDDPVFKGGCGRW